MKFFVVPALAGSIMLAGVAGAFAADVKTTAPAASTVATAPAKTVAAAPADAKLLTEEQVMMKLKAEGFTKVTDLKKDAAGTGYAASAVTKDGKTVALMIDGKTGVAKAQ